jgi:hypothetical protein
MRLPTLPALSAALLTEGAAPPKDAGAAKTFPVGASAACSELLLLSLLALPTVPAPECSRLN